MAIFSNRIKSNRLSSQPFFVGHIIPGSVLFEQNENLEHCDKNGYNIPYFGN